MRPSLTRVAGHAKRSGQDGASRGGIRCRGERRGAQPDSCRPRPAKDSQGIGRQGFVALGGLRLAFGAANRSRSIARGRRAPEGGAVAPLRAVSGPPKQDRARTGSAHPLRSTDVSSRSEDGTNLALLKHTCDELFESLSRKHVMPHFKASSVEVKALVAIGLKPPLTSTPPKPT